MSRHYRTVDPSMDFDERRRWRYEQRSRRRAREEAVENFWAVASLAICALIAWAMCWGASWVLGALS